ncbi:DUF3298 and DUF4163 domain-containing protein [Proteiniborus sp. MB09-C3]|uniref:DUF3298 and DUF4163 domain-containing protein n=1 Tax=Proteiniborus sp. MB09-C3 TaxID=3050072 RepID=UPI002554FFC1|nr:DUF3298 and DUF4163 domain-containing protein [Proteiniborus sp. MB09-C3]WIV11258.1 DUF3298 domain-containing protein [Proteiniborus sp. MB09-C3]
MDFRYLPVMIQTHRYYIPTTDILYPMVYGLRNPVAQEKINFEIYRLMLKIASELRQPDRITYITGSYELKANQRDFLSLTLGQLGNFGGAHPMTIIKALNMDVSTGRVYELKDLFKPGSNYVKRISEIVDGQIKERDIPLLEEFKGIWPDQDFYIVDNNLIIFFQLYEISPYVAGFPYFSIPIYKLQDIIVEDGILSRMMGI